MCSVRIGRERKHRKKMFASIITILTLLLGYLFRLYYGYNYNCNKQHYVFFEEPVLAQPPKIKTVYWTYRNFEDLEGAKEFAEEFETACIPTGRRLYRYFSIFSCSNRFLEKHNLEFYARQKKIIGPKWSQSRSFFKRLVVLE